LFSERYESLLAWALRLTNEQQEAAEEQTLLVRGGDFREYRFAEASFELVSSIFSKVSGEAHSRSLILHKPR